MSAEEGGEIRAEIGWKLFSINEIPGLVAWEKFVFVVWKVI